MDVSFRKQETIDNLPAEFLFHYSCGRIMKELPNLHVGSLIELKEGIEELTKTFNIHVVKQPEQVREALSINVIDVEESEIKLILENN